MVEIDKIFGIPIQVCPAMLPNEWMLVPRPTITMIDVDLKDAEITVNYRAFYGIKQQVTDQRSPPSQPADLRL